MEAFAIRNLTFFYPNQHTPALSDIQFSVARGEFLLLCGFSGCGKSTLLRHLKPALAPHGKFDGTILFNGKPLPELSAREQAQRIGFVQQNPDHQIVTDKVWHEMAFGLESLGCDTPTIRRRVAEMASFFGIQTWFHLDVAQLSGGQKQLLNLAAVMVMQPEVLILDEPTTQLDPIAASDFLAMLSKINRELGTTILLSEHHLEEALPLANRIAVLDCGKLLCIGNAHEIGDYLKSNDHGMFIALPAPMRVWAAVENNLRCPLSVREGRDWLMQIQTQLQLLPLPATAAPVHSTEVALHCNELWFRYEKDSADIVKGLSVTLRKGELLALLGGNGSGKTTSLKLLAGLLKPYRGKRNLFGTIGLLPQNPQTLFVKNSIYEDLLEACTDTEQIHRVVQLCHLEDLLNRHPYDLSGGEQQRAALAKVLLSKPEILFMDEPTKGLDASFKTEFGTMLKQLSAQGTAILMVSHDIDFCAEYAHRCALLFDGTIVTDDAPPAFFSSNCFYTTAANRMAKEWEPHAITVSDVIAICGGQQPSAPQALKKADTLTKHVAESAASVPCNKTTFLQNQKARWMVIAVLLFLIPLTLWFGMTFLEGRKYYFMSLLILMEAMLPVFLLFEGRKPRARELVVIAVLCAIGVAGRAILFMLPQFKPVMAIVIIAGAALGSETGFLVGALTMLVSNMLFGQGIWTPWQMFAMGLIGFLAGVLFHSERLPQTRSVLTVFGCFSAIFLYGGIMNPASALIWTHKLNLEIILAYYLSGLPMDCVHAMATGIFLWFGGEFFLEKLKRIKMKYGLPF